MQRRIAGFAAWLMMAVTGCALAGGPAEPVVDENAGQVEDKTPEKPNFDMSAFLALPVESNPLADEILVAWTKERDAILSGTAAPLLDWHERVRDYQKTSEESGDPFVQEVYQRIALDQYGRFEGPFSPEGAHATASRLGFEIQEDDAAAVTDRLMRQFILIDMDNTAFLQRELAARGGRWWTVAEVGSDAAHMIWLLTQHADQTPEFQQYALEQMIPLLETGDVNRNNYAYLWDRVAVADGRPQRFGTQGRCMGPGDWVADEIEAPAEEVNQRRADFDISMTFEENDSRLDAVCPQ